MQLFLVQHGEAKPKAENPERPLTDGGVQAVEQLARWASRAGLRPAQIRHSGKRRAEQTAAILGEYLKPPDGVIAVPDLDPTDDVNPVARAMEHDNEPLMLVGHMPFLGRLVGGLVAADPEAPVVRFTNAGIVCLRREEGQWLIDWAVPPQLMA